MTKQKAIVDADLAEANETIAETEAALAKLQGEKKKLEASGSDLADNLSTAEENIAKLTKDKQGLDLKVKGLTSDLEARDGSIASLQNEKKRLEQTTLLLLMTCKLWKTRPTTLERPRPSLNKLSKSLK